MTQGVPTGSGARGPNGGRIVGGVEQRALVSTPRAVETKLVPDLGDILTLSIDPNWPYMRLWTDIFRTPKMNFSFIDLEEGIQEQASVNYQDVDVVGRAESYKIFSGVSNREIPLVFKFRAQGLSDQSDTEALRREVYQKAKWLDGLKYPIRDRDTGITHAPPPCQIVLGELLRERVIATSVEIHWQAPFDTTTLLPYGADVSCTFTVVHAQPGNYDYLGSARLV